MLHQLGRIAVYLKFAAEVALGRTTHGELITSLVNEVLMLAAVGTPHTPSFRWRPQLPDPDDEMILELAVNARADAIVTVNTQDFLPTAGTFGVEVLRPGEFLRRLRS